MANIFAILTAVLLAAAAFLAHKNKEAYSKEITERQDAERQLTATRARLKGLQEKRDKTIEDREATELATVGLREEEEKQMAKNDAIKTDISAKRKLLSLIHI